MAQTKLGFLRDGSSDKFANIMAKRAGGTAAKESSSSPVSLKESPVSLKESRSSSSPEVPSAQDAQQPEMPSPRVAQQPEMSRSQVAQVAQQPGRRRTSFKIERSRSPVGKVKAGPREADTDPVGKGSAGPHEAPAIDSVGQAGLRDVQDNCIDTEGSESDADVVGPPSSPPRYSVTVVGTRDLFVRVPAGEDTYLRVQFLRENH